LLLLTRLAVRGSTKVQLAQKVAVKPNDRGLARYAGKFAVLPDGLPFSLRLLLEDGQGKGQRDPGGPREWSFGDLPDAIQLQALRAALAAEAQTREAVKDEEFADLLDAALKRLDIHLDRRTGLTRKHVVNLRAKLEYQDLARLFPNRMERQEQWYDPQAENAS
jgi:hypothetical protein